MDGAPDGTADDLSPREEALQSHQQAVARLAVEIRPVLFEASGDVRLGDLEGRVGDASRDVIELLHEPAFDDERSPGSTSRSVRTTTTAPPAAAAPADGRTPRGVPGPGGPVVQPMPAARALNHPRPA
jgi:hypothetical protein